MEIGEGVEDTIFEFDWMIEVGYWNCNNIKQSWDTEWEVERKVQRRKFEFIRKVLWQKLEQAGTLLSQLTKLIYPQIQTPAVGEEHYESDD